MSPKKATEAMVNGAVEVSVLDQLRLQLAAAEKGIGCSEELTKRLEAAKLEVARLTAELRPFSEARNMVSNLKAAIRSLEAPLTRAAGNRSVVMTPEVKAKLSQAHKAIWAKRKAAAASQSQAS
jgi:hypothetical protein